MKKGLKLGMLAVAFLAAMTAVVSTGKVAALSGDNKVEVEISPYNGGVNDCSGSDYKFAFSGSAAVQTGTKTGYISCAFGQHAQIAVTLELTGTLKNGANQTIPSENIHLQNGLWTTNPEEGLGSEDSQAATFVPLTGTISLFNKVDNKIGDASGTDLTIEVVVPEGQPDGTYTGTLVLTF